MSLADLVEDRMIHYTLDVFLRPPKGQEVGHTDPAWDIGEQLGAAISQSAKEQAEAAGFSVEIFYRQVVY